MNLLITGGTGSLGQAIVANLLAYRNNQLPFDKIIIYSRDEQKQNDMRQKFNDNPKLRFFIGDVRDKDRLRLAIKSNANYIIHAAALKIVPALEYNPIEAIKTNIYGAQNLIEVCLEDRGVSKILGISTDKAVAPINLYGATKLCAEKLFIDGNNICGEYGPKFSVCRYGNVACSRGSVVPFFAQCADQGKKLPITDPLMTRFWISLHDAALFVMQCLEQMTGAEIFVPDMRSFRVIDLVECFEKYYDQDNMIGSEIVGVRPGEKLHEELITKYEMADTIYDNNNSFIIKKRDLFSTSDEVVKQMLEEGFTSNSSFVEKLSVDVLAIKLKELGVIKPHVEIPTKRFAKVG